LLTRLRVRFARLSCIRKILGSKPEDLELPFDASSFTEDDEYLILDLVLNWVSTRPNVDFLS
jgi:hypothetical protein